MNLSRRLFLRQSVAATATITAVAAPVIAEGSGSGGLCCHRAGLAR